MVQNRQNFAPNKFSYQIIWPFVELWRAGLLSLKFCVLSSYIVLRKKVENKKFNKPALLWANISLFLTWIIANICCCFVQLDSHFFISFTKPARTPTDSFENFSTADIKFQLVSKYLKKVKLTECCHPNILIWYNLNNWKWWWRYSFCQILNFPNH